MAYQLQYSAGHYILQVSGGVHKYNVHNLIFIQNNIVFKDLHIQTDSRKHTFWSNQFGSCNKSA